MNASLIVLVALSLLGLFAGLLVRHEKKRTKNHAPKLISIAPEDTRGIHPEG